MSHPNLRIGIEIDVVPTALLAENYKNNPTTEYRMEGLLYAGMNRSGRKGDEYISKRCERELSCTVLTT